jgi:hypothetical protein
MIASSAPVSEICLSPFASMMRSAAASSVAFSSQIAWKISFAILF